jgi:hypothetical protein
MTRRALRPAAAVAGSGKHGNIHSATERRLTWWPLNDVDRHSLAEEYRKFRRYSNQLLPGSVLRSCRCLHARAAAVRTAYRRTLLWWCTGETLRVLRGAYTLRTGPTLQTTTLCVTLRAVYTHTEFPNYRTLCSCEEALKTWNY